MWCSLYSLSVCYVKEYRVLSDISIFIHGDGWPDRLFIYDFLSSAEMEIRILIRKWLRCFNMYSLTLIVFDGLPIVHSFSYINWFVMTLHIFG